MEYMESKMQEQIEAGISAAEECYNRIAELEAERDALAAQAEALGDKLSEVVTLLDVDGMTAVQWLLDNCQEIEALTDIEPQQHLRNVRVNAIENALDYMYSNTHSGNSAGDDFDLIRDYAKSVRASDK